MKSLFLIATLAVSPFSNDLSNAVDLSNNSEMEKAEQIVDSLLKSNAPGQDGVRKKNPGSSC